MQTSSIMLGSTLSKILTAKRVGQQTHVETGDKHRDTESGGQTSSRAEAEVRLVVRFIVEEQIVYKGKVERVNQLDSEELSRVVSRVAWDDTNDSDKPVSTETVPCLDQNTAETTDCSVMDQHNHQSSPTLPEHDVSTPSAVSDHDIATTPTISDPDAATSPALSDHEVKTPPAIVDPDAAIPPAMFEPEVANALSIPDRGEATPSAISDHEAVTTPTIPDQEAATPPTFPDHDVATSPDISDHDAVTPPDIYNFDAAITPAISDHDTATTSTVSDHDAVTTLIEDQTRVEVTERRDHVQANSSSNNESSDHEAYARTSADPDALSVCQDNSVSQPDESCANNLTTPNQCDINPERSSSPLCETNHGSPHILTPVQDSDKQQDSSANQLLNSSIHPTREIDESNHNCMEYQVESQTVTDTLNDCVEIVDIESRQQQATVTFESSIREVTELPIVKEKTEEKVEEKLKQEPLSSWPESKQNEGCKLNGLENNESETISRKTSSNISSNECCITNELEKPNGTLPNCSSTNREVSNIFDARDTVAENSIPYGSDAGGSNKRKSHGKNGSSAKRIRRSTNKEQRNSITRTSAGTNVENTRRRQSTNSRCSNVSLLADNQPIRQNKIFAKWTDNHFYPGTILKLSKDRKYVVGFFDGAQRNVAETDLIPLCNIEGKQVRVSIAKNYCVNAIVHVQRSPVNDQPMFDVEYQQDGVVRKCVPFKDIFLTGEQGTPLISQPERNPGASNFADVDLDNIIYEKRSRRFQDMEDFELTDNSSLSLSL